MGNTVLKAAGVSVEPYWPGLFAKALEGMNVKELITNFGSSAGAAPAAGAAAPAAGVMLLLRKPRKKRRRKNPKNRMMTWDSDCLTRPRIDKFQGRGECLVEWSINKNFKKKFRKK